MTSPEMRSTRRGLLLGGVAVAAMAGVGFLSRFGLSANAANLGTSGEVTIENFSPSGKSLGTGTLAKVVKTEAEWRKQLSPLAFEKLPLRAIAHLLQEVIYNGSIGFLVLI